jgi:hypothetical protein
MSKPAKDAAALLKRAGEAIRKALIKPPGCTESTGCAVGPCHCAHVAAEAALAAIRAAGWAVVPVEPTWKMIRVMDNYDDMMQDETTIQLWKDTLAAAPEVKP